MKRLFNVVVIVQEKYDDGARNCDPHSCAAVATRVGCVRRQASRLGSAARERASKIAASAEVLTVNVCEWVHEEAHDDDSQHHARLDQELVVANGVVGQQLLKVDFHLVAHVRLEVLQRVVEACWQRDDGTRGEKDDEVVERHELLQHVACSTQGLFRFV